MDEYNTGEDPTDELLQKLDTLEAVDEFLMNNLSLDELGERLRQLKTTGVAR